ncbi:ROK family protein [Pedobacter panaciterrae]|jgi:Transcriptional regulator/sugar kinase|uniref:ROK family protein n=1 Tax=Pedobacter panaciterrae TaxID=363849 RepID=A0ABU8NG72_9SPHI|nr:ROK family protein [Pedobacter panaciterrae]NQX57070.1 ROK family protein [Pedobacter panaciterrae]
MPVKQKKESGNNILSIDIGGTSIKACILSSKGDLLSEFKKLPTPKNSTPEEVIKTIKELVSSLEDTFDRISIGFPGYVKCGKVETAPNLAKNKWTNVNLAQQVSNLFNRPVRLINDADQQALGIVSGIGFEIVFTVGTGFGTALVFDGELLPHFELAHLPVTKTKDYDDYIGTKAFEKIGKKDWNERLERIIQIYKTVFNYDTLYIGGGNSKHITFELDHNIHLVTNKDGIKGGAKLWEVAEKYHVYTTRPNDK